MSKNISLCLTLVTIFWAQYNSVFQLGKVGNLEQIKTSGFALGINVLLPIAVCTRASPSVGNNTVSHFSTWENLSFIIARAQLQYQYIKQNLKHLENKLNRKTVIQSIKSNQIKSNQIKSNQIQYLYTAYTHSSNYTI